ncbi:hypothetical protein [Pseudoalteromonas rubra]|nr:hypothetical protein [Pseudoalteromonas rubra]
MAENIGVCKLCFESKELRKSHIIPRSYFKHAKSNGQLVWVNEGEELAKLTNSDPKERLLCQSCEQLLSQKYENYGTRIFLDRSKISRCKHDDNLLVFKDYDYLKVFLYLASILWRALVSNRYSNMDLGQFNEMLRQCILKGKICIKACLRLDHFLHIYVCKIRDKSGQITGEQMRRVILDLNVEETRHPGDGIIYYMMLHGFLIVYHCSAVNDIQEKNAKKGIGKLKKKGKMLIEIKDLTDFDVLVRVFNVAVSKRESLKEPK